MSMSKEWAFYTRDPRRHSLMDVPEAKVEFEYPREGGRRWQLRLINISEGGLCFEVDPEFPAVTRNVELKGLVVRVDDLEFRGDFVFSHARTEGERSIICGGQFRPATEVDQIKMRNMIAELGSIPQANS